LCHISYSLRTLYYPLTLSIINTSYRPPFIPSLEIKKLATGLHYLSLCALGLLYFVEHEWTRNACILTALFFVLAMFIPPTGMIKQEDAPAAAHKSMSYMPEKGFEDPSADGDDAASADAAKGAEKKTKKKGGNNKKKNK
jgi:hypothetical protein